MSDTTIKLEHRHEPLLGRRAFVRRLARYAILAGAILLFSLGIGVVGYRYLGEEGGQPMGWIRALLNAAMILTGMGPVDTPSSDIGQVFASFYALYSGVVFLVVVGVMFAPVAHRLLHLFHLEEGSPDTRP